MRSLFCIPLLLLASCSVDVQGENDSSDAGSKLNEQAVSAGILPDKDTLGLSGQFETRSELGVDKFCATKNGNNFDIGVLAVFGPDSKCEARGSAKMVDEKLEINFTGKKECSFQADYDGVAIRFPGVLSDECDSYCTPRASFSGTSYYIIAQGDAAARKTLGRDMERLCN